MLEQYGRMANHFSYSPQMMSSLQKRWAKMDHKLFLVAYVLHPARQLQHINQDLEFANANNIATYAEELYQRLLGGSAADHASVFKQTASYLGNQGAFKKSIPRYQDTSEDPSLFWGLMTQTAPQLAHLAIHLSQLAVNSAAVERLFSSFLNIQTKRRNRLVHERVQKIHCHQSNAASKAQISQQASRQSVLGGKTCHQSCKAD